MNTETRTCKHKNLTQRSNFVNWDAKKSKRSSVPQLLVFQQYRSFQSYSTSIIHVQLKENREFLAALTISDFLRQPSRKSIPKHAFLKCVVCAFLPLSALPSACVEPLFLLHVFLVFPVLSFFSMWIIAAFCHSVYPLRCFCVVFSFFGV